METHCLQLGLGKPVLYLHGWGASGEIFLPVASRLPDYSNYMIDFFGFGKSPLPQGGGLTVFDYVCQVEEFLTERKLTNVTIVAHSFGCRVAMALAAKYPQLVNRLLLFAPAGLRRFSLARWCKIRLYKVKKRLSKRAFTKGGSDDYAATPNELKSTFVKVVNQDLSAYARRINCKTLIVAGKRDSAVLYKDAKRLNKLIKNSELVGVDGDHFALFYTPAEFAQIVKLFAEE